MTYVNARNPIIPETDRKFLRRFKIEGIYSTYLGGDPTQKQAAQRY